MGERLSTDGKCGIMSRSNVTRLQYGVSSRKNSREEALMTSGGKNLGQVVSLSPVNCRLVGTVLTTAAILLTTSGAWGGHRHHGASRYCGPIAPRYCAPIARHHWGGGAGLHCYRGPYTQWSCRPPIQWRSPCFYPPIPRCYSVRPGCGWAFPGSCFTYYWSSATFLDVRPVGIAPWFAAAPADLVPADIAPNHALDPNWGFAGAKPQVDPQLAARLNQPIRVAGANSPVRTVREAAQVSDAALVRESRPARDPAPVRAAVVASDTVVRPSSDTARRRAEKFVRQGDELFRRGRHFEALSLYQHARSAAPDLAASSVREGFAYIAVRRYDRAAGAFRRATEIDARYLTDTFRLNELYGEDATATEQKSTHLEQLAQAAVERPELADLVYLTGVFLLSDGQSQRAASFLARAREMDGTTAATPAVQLAARP